MSKELKAKADKEAEDLGELLFLIANAFQLAKECIPNKREVPNSARCSYSNEHQVVLTLTCADEIQAEILHDYVLSKMAPLEKIMIKRAMRIIRGESDYHSEGFSSGDPSWDQFHTEIWEKKDND